MLNRYGGYLQNLTLKVVGFLDRFPTECQHLIMTLSKRCRLESLTLDVGTLHTKYDFFSNLPRKVELDILVKFVANAFRLKCFYLKAWPLSTNTTEVQLLEALKENPKLKNLEKLGLFWQGAGSTDWTTLNATLPSPDHILSVVQHFNNVCQLGLRSPMLTEDIIEALCQSHRVRMEKLSILITYTGFELLGGNQEIPSATWKKLRQHSPQLEVEMTVATRMPFVDLAGYLKPEIPVSTLEFMKHSRLGHEDLVSICDKYFQTLSKFLSFNDSEGLDASLKLLVTHCQKMTYLVFHGNLNYRTVMELASLRGPKWHSFRVLGKAIQLTDTQPLADIDPDVILIETAPGRVELVEIVRQRMLQEEEAHFDQRYEEMIQAVSKEIDEKWRPDISCSSC